MSLIESFKYNSKINVPSAHLQVVEMEDFRSKFSTFFSYYISVTSRNELKFFLLKFACMRLN